MTAICSAPSTSFNPATTGDDADGQPRATRPASPTAVRRRPQPGCRLHRRFRARVEPATISASLHPRGSPNCRIMLWPVRGASDALPCVDDADCAPGSGHPGDCRVVRATPTLRRKESARSDWWKGRCSGQGFVSCSLTGCSDVLACQGGPNDASYQPVGMPGEPAQAPVSFCAPNETCQFANRSVSSVPRSIVPVLPVCLPHHRGALLHHQDRLGRRKRGGWSAGSGRDHSAHDDDGGRLLASLFPSRSKHEGPVAAKATGPSCFWSY
jgi:hypothetical protein